MPSFIEVLSSPELTCDRWSAAAVAVPAGVVRVGDERTNWAAADHTHVALSLRLPAVEPDDAVWPDAVTIERYEVEEIELGAAPPRATPFLYLVRMDVDPAAEDEFNAWYTSDHVANLSQVDGVHSARRFRAINAADDVRKYLAIYYLDCPSVRQSAQWQRAAHTDWSIRIRAHHRRKLATMFVPTGAGFAHGGSRSAA